MRIVCAVLTSCDYFVGGIQKTREEEEEWLLLEDEGIYYLRKDENEIIEIDVDEDDIYNSVYKEFEKNHILRSYHFIKIIGCDKLGRYRIDFRTYYNYGDFERREI